MQKDITVNVLYKEFAHLPSVASDAVLTLTIRKASGGTLAGGTFAYSAGFSWLLSFTPATLNEIYDVQVVDADGDLVFSGSYKALGAVYDATTGPSGSISVGTNSWITGQEAENYFATRFGVGTNWSALTDANKVAALITACQRIKSCADFSIDADEDDQNVKDAQCEMALFLIIHAADMDARMGLQAQGVTQAGIVQETYDKDVRNGVVIPGNVRALLTEYETGGVFFATDVARDDEEDV